MSRAGTGRDRWWTAALFVGAGESVGFLSAWASGMSRTNSWIDDTAKPALWPPRWFFPFVFAVVNYPSLGLATWLVWRRRNETPIGGAMRLFGAQLAYNAAFLPLVYHVRRRSFFVAMDCAGVLLTAATARSYARVARPAGYVIAPYACWLCFTTSIKACWWRMNQRSA